MTPEETKALIEQEYKNCAGNPVHFICNYVWINNPVKGPCKFELYPFQKQVVKDLQENRFNIVLKSRQMGLSTLLAAYALWTMLFHKGKTIMVISLKQEVAKEYISKIAYANEKLPSWLRARCIEDNRLSIKFENGSEIKASSTTKYSGVSYALSWLIFDEAALIENSEELWTSAQPALSLGGKAVILSTPRGAKGFFYQLWKNTDTNEFHQIKLPWHLHPERNQAWRDEEGRKLGNPEKAKQEFDCDFLATGHTIVDGDTIRHYQKEVEGIEPLAKKESGLRIYALPQVGHRYLCMADPASGYSTDFSAAHILDISTLKYEEVLCFKGKISPTDFANQLVEWCKSYGECGLIVERQGLGLATLEQINNLEYRNLIHCSNDLSEFCFHTDLEASKLTYGFPTTVRTRQLIIDRLEEMLRTRSILLKDERTIDELLTFVDKGGKPQAMSGFNDDLIMSLAIGLYVGIAMSRQLTKGIEMTKNLMGGMKKTTGGVNQSPSNASAVYSTSGNTNKAWKWQTQHGEEDLRWLID